MIDLLLVRFYEFQTQFLKRSDYSAFVKDASAEEKTKLLKKAAKIAKFEQRKVLEEAAKKD